jgi:hypothetical protein
VQARAHGVKVFLTALRIVMRELSKRAASSSNKITSGHNNLEIEGETA